jgi:hypothetical protein
MRLPKGHSRAGVKIRLVRSLYGLKQAGELWFQNLTKSLKAYGCVQMIHDPCVFKHTSKTGSPVFIIIYVDDIIFTGPDINEMTKLTDFLRTTVRSLTVDTSTGRYIGVDLNRRRSELKIELSQQQMHDDIFRKSGFPVKFRDRPMNQSLDYVTKGDGTEPPMRSEAGALGFLTDRTRPDLLASRGTISKAAHKPSTTHRSGWKHIVQHLHTSRDTKLVLGGQGISFVSEARRCQTQRSR